MKKIAILLIVFCAFTLSGFAYEAEIRSIDISLRLMENGDALVSENWDVTVAQGSEWYLVRNNLGESKIQDLSVSDETSRKYINEGEWDLDRGISQKAGRCGLVSKSDGCEICWGVGSYGPHKYSVSYTLTGAVRALDDKDYFHWQLVTPGLSSRPKRVRVVVEAPSARLDSTICRAWGFGYEGSVAFADGKVEFASTEEFSRNSSVIALLSFEKGLFSPAIIKEGSFTEHLDNALKGSSFADDITKEEEDWFAIAVFFLFIIFFVVGPIRYALRISGTFVTKRDKKKMMGCRPDEVVWFRDPPYKGDLLKTEYTMRRLGEIKGNDTMAAALILRMIYQGYLAVSKDSKNKIEIHFASGVSLDGLPSMARELYDMMREASGEDKVLQDREFSKWSSRSANQKRILKWTTNYKDQGKAQLTASGELVGTKYTESGHEGVRACYGFKKFLDDFTMVKDKATIEVALWQEYLVYASLLGIADKVAKELRDIDMSVAEKVLMTGPGPSSYELIRMTQLMSRAITHASAAGAAAAASGAGSSRSGFGGGASFGGGGGFSGGGFGGGAR